MPTKSYKKMNQDDIRMMNYLLVLRILRMERATSMPQLSQQTQLTLPSISSIMSELEMYGLVKKAGVIQAKRGRFPTLYTFNEEAFHVIGLSIRADMISAGLVNLDGTVLKVLSQPLETNRQPRKIVETCVSLICSFMKDPKQQRNILGVGVSMHGVVNPNTAVSVYPAHLRWNNFPFGESLSPHFASPIMMDNDINCLVLAEKWFGQAKDDESFIVLNVDYGIGAGIMSNGAILHGANFGSGQIGHVSISGGQVLCDCGKLGCLETVASEKAILRDIKQAMHEGQTTQLRTLVPQNGEAALDHVYEAASNGDSLAISTLRRVGHHLGMGASILVNLLNPQKIILTGGILRGMAFILPELSQSISDHSLSTNTRALELTTSELGPHSDVIGAATLWIEALFTGKIPFTSLAQSQ